jgi:lipoprotein LprG
MLAAIVTTALLGLSGCHKDAPAVTLPDGTALVSQSATAMRNVQSAHITIDTAGDIGAIPLRTAEGDLTRVGDAKGSIKLLTLGVVLQLDFVVVGQDYFIKGLSGGWQKQSAADVATFYDPSGILDPTRGVAKVLSTATNARTEAAESVNGVDSFRVGVSLDSSAVAGVVPGVPNGITGKLWIDQSSKRLVRAVLSVPSTTGKPGVVTINLTDLDKPVTVSAPV